MKICVTVSEYNPFHNGHLYHLTKMKEMTKADYLVVIMSGNFTQRGEIALLDKYTRARHAVLGGADIVFELPTVYATASAEIFAKGAIKLIDCLQGEKVLCFGCESGDKKSFLETAFALNEESKEFKENLKRELDTGVSFAKARLNAIERTGGSSVNLDLLNSPNNILGIEYCRAILSLGAKIDILPILRKDSGYKDTQIGGEIASAMAIRKALSEGKKKKTKKCLPSFVYDDLPDSLPSIDKLLLYSALKTPKSEMKKIVDCTEGLENRIKAMLKDCDSEQELLDKLLTRRYTSTRLKRILLSCLLGIDKNLTEKSLSSKGYLKVLAVKKSSLSLLSSLQKSKAHPFVTRKSMADSLSGKNKLCFEKDVFSCDLYGIVTGKHINEYDMKIIDV